MSTSPSPVSGTNSSQPREILTLSDDEERTVFAVWMTGSILSLLGSIFIIVTILYLRRLSIRASRLVFMLNIAATLESISALLAWNTFEKELDNPNLCVFQGFLTQFSQMALFSWTTIISVDLFLYVVKNVSVTRTHEYFFHIYGWGVPLLFTVLPLFTDAYGPAGVWCWIRAEDDAQFWRWIAFYIPLYVQVVVVIVLYGMVVHAVRSRLDADTTRSSQDKKRASRLMLRLRAYPLIVLALYIFPTINRIYDAASPDDSMFLWFMHALTASLLGFCSAVAYGFDKPIRSQLSAKLYGFGICTGCTAPLGDDEVDYYSDSDSGAANFDDGNVELA